MSAGRVTVILPVKPWSLSKSRLDVSADDRERLARAFALDVLAVLERSSRVGRLMVVTADPGMAGEAQRAGAILLVDRPLVTADGLGAALAQSRSWAAVHRANLPVVVVPADLPALDVASFDEAVDRLVGARPTFVPDARGTGTTLYCAPSPSTLACAYGPRSAARHSAAGASAVLGIDARVRHDVDTVGDLLRARDLGLGPHTAGLVEKIGVRQMAGTGQPAGPPRPPCDSGASSRTVGDEAAVRSLSGSADAASR